MDDGDEPPPFHKGNFRLYGLEEENKLVNKLMSQYIVLAAVPVAVVNFTAKALFKTVLKNPKYQQLWNAGAIIQAFAITTFVLSRISKRVSTEFPQGFMAQMHYLRTNPEAMQEFKTFKRDCKSGRKDYHTELLINKTILDSNAVPKYNVPTQTSKTSSNANTNVSDMRYKLYRAGLLAEPVPIMERHTCVKARTALYEKRDPAASPESSMYTNAQYLVLYDGPQTATAQTTQPPQPPPQSYSRLKHAALKQKESSQEDKSAIVPPVGSYKLWRQNTHKTDSSIDPNPRIEPLRSTSSKTDSQRPNGLQKDLYNAGNQQIYLQTQSDIESTGLKQEINTKIESQGNKRHRRNLYGDAIEPDVRWKNR